MVSKYIRFNVYDGNIKLDIDDIFKLKESN